MDSIESTDVDAADRDLSSQIPGAIGDTNFCASWLAIQCNLIGGVTAGLILINNSQGSGCEPVAMWPNDPGSAGQLMGLGQRALQERSALIAKRQHASRGDGPSEGYEVAYPIHHAEQVAGCVVLAVTSRPKPQLESALQQLSWGSAWIEVWLQRRKTLEQAAVNERLKGLLDLLATTVEHHGFEAAAIALVTDLAARLACQRVSLGLVANQRVKLVAMSNSSAFAKRANLSRAIEAAMEEVLDQQAPVVYPPMEQSAKQLHRCHQELARQQGSAAICSLPLANANEIYGVLTCERPSSYDFDGESIELCEAVASLAGPILELKHREERPLAQRARDRLATNIADLTGPDYMAPKVIAVSLAILAIFLALATTEYRVPAKALLEAQSQRAAVAPFNGYITASYVRAGDLVRPGQVLFTLDDRDLKLEELKWRSQKEQYLKQYHLAMADHNAAQIKIAMAQIGQVDAELALVEDQLARTQVRAQSAGVITKGDLSQSIGAPTERGQVLFEAAPLDSYRLVLQLDERDVARVISGQRGNVVLAALPSQSLPFIVTTITPVSEAREGRNYFRVEAKLDNPPAHLRPGMEGVGKIDLGRRSLLWSWTHRLTDWLRLLVWSWAP